MRAKRRRRDRGNGATRKLASGTFEARITIGYDAEGRRVRKNVYADSEDALRAAIAREQQRLARKPRHYADAERITLEAFLKEWLESEVRAENRRATYVLREATIRNHITPHLGTLKLAHIEDDHIRGLLRTLTAKDVGARTRQVVHATLRRAFQVAVRDKLLSDNPVTHVDRPKAQRNEKHILDEKQARTLLDAASDGAYYALYVLALTTGMRQGEIFALEWADIDLQNAALRVRATLSEDEDGNLNRTAPKTPSSRRIVHLPAIAVEALREHRVRTEGFEGYVFSDSTGGPLRKSNFLRRDFHPMLERPRVCEDCKAPWMRGREKQCPQCGSERSKRAIPRITFHTLRHVANSILLARGANVRLLADRLGHSTTRTTLEHYSHVLPGAQREAARTLDAVFGT